MNRLAGSNIAVSCADISGACGADGHPSNNEVPEKTAALVKRKSLPEFGCIGVAIQNRAPVISGSLSYTHGPAQDAMERHLILQDKLKRNGELPVQCSRGSNVS